jgi:hypothetical protein
MVTGTPIKWEVPVTRVSQTDMGGERAPGTPEESAQHILDIIEKKKEIIGNSSFIDYKGEPMPL